MSTRVKKLLVVCVSPLLSAVLLGGIVAENRRYLKPDDFEPYHTRAKAAIESILKQNVPPWVGSESNDVPREAQVLLKPNKILSLSYFDPSVSSLGTRTVNLLVVQCKLASDMVGHFPPICYPSHGMEMIVNQDRDWVVHNHGSLDDVQRITGKEYQFRETKDGQTFIRTVYNFMVVPGRGIVRDIKGVEQAAEDYQQRYYGAAQFQLVFQASSSDDITREKRDEIFCTLMEPVVPVIRTLDTTLKNVGLKNLALKNSKSGASQ